MIFLAVLPFLESNELFLILEDKCLHLCFSNLVIPLSEPVLLTVWLVFEDQTGNNHNCWVFQIF